MQRYKNYSIFCLLLSSACLLVIFVLGFFPDTRISLLPFAITGVAAGIAGICSSPVILKKFAFGKEGLNSEFVPLQEGYEERTPKKSHEDIVKEQAKAPPKEETKDSIGVKEDKDNLPLFELSGLDFADLYRAAFLYNDMALVNKTLQHYKVEKNWSEEKTQTFKYEILNGSPLVDAISELKRLEKENGSWFFPSTALAKHYLQSDLADQAIHHVEIALLRARDSQETLDAKILKSRILTHLGQDQEAVTLLKESLKDNKSNNDSRVQIYQAIADVYKHLESSDSEAYYLEAALKISPDNHGLRFRLAYLYSNSKNSLAAFHHYKILANLKPDYPSVENNFALVLGEFEMLGKKIYAYNKAAQYGETLPIGNIIVDLVSSGFFEEAQKHLDQVPQDKQNEERIVAARNYLQEKKQTEEARFLEIEDRASSLQLFRDKFINAELSALETIDMPIEELAGNWPGSDSSLRLETKDGLLIGIYTTKNFIYRATGKKEGALLIMNVFQTKKLISQGALSALLMGALSPKEPEWQDVSFFDADSFDIKFFIKSRNEIEGYRIKPNKELEKYYFAR